MDFRLAGALLSLLPGLALWTNRPARGWGAWALLAASLIAWAAGYAFVGEEMRAPWTLFGLWSAAGCAYAGLRGRFEAGRYDSMEAFVRERAAKRAELQQAVLMAREKASRTETEQREVLALYALIKGMAESLSWEEVKPKLELAVRQYLGVEEFALYSVDLRAANEVHPLLIRRLSGSVGASWDTLSRFFQEKGLGMTVPNAIESPERAVAVPIHDASELMGYLYARCPAAADPHALMEKTASFCEEIAFAFRRIKLFQELERLSQIDGLTGVYRRGMLDERLKEEVVRARTFKISFCLLLMDIDHFKKLNDTYGHPFGDQVLRRVGEILKASVYETDFVARYGGEEFAVLLPRAEAAGVLRKAESIRTAIERAEFPLAMETVRITVSIGIAHFPRDGSTPDAIVHEADQALYYAKESGRNRAVDIADVPGKKIHGRHQA
ncbi:MAG: GGDEF domain-containing protein [Elusimicrobia bacterium]|nr:GGDEF domain-containing protein [Elusimicrobiota bacterium]